MHYVFGVFFILRLLDCWNFRFQTLDFRFLKKEKDYVMN